MMIGVTVSPGFAGSYAEVFAGMNPLARGGEMLWHSASRAVFRLEDGSRIVLAGDGLAWSDGVLQGGSVEALAWRRGAEDLVTFATLQTTGAALWAAFEAGRDGSDPLALAEILTHHCWTYHGNEGADLFPEAFAQAGGYDPHGNDKVFLYGGDDLFFTGSARDTIYGDGGNDTLSGGSENDALYGAAEDDLLMGGRGDDLGQGWIGADVLQGGEGADTLYGGLGADVLEGGSGDDLLSGGGRGGT